MNSWKVIAHEPHPAQRVAEQSDARRPGHAAEEAVDGEPAEVAGSAVTSA
jgi:hypothetical protein